jgi:hypothetical protein
MTGPKVRPQRVAGVLCVLLSMPALSVSASAKQPTITTFDPPGSVKTYCESINPAGAITGYFFDANNLIHGFLRAPDGTFTTFDAPGAGTSAYQGTTAFSINLAGVITGWSATNSGGQGYVRAPDGTFTTFDAPGAVGTLPENINPEGAIAGQYIDASSVYHGFVRAPDGTITTFDAPGAGSGPGQGTLVASVEGINPEGAIALGYIYTGNLFSGTQVLNGAVRAPDGTFTEFDVPGMGTGAGQGTVTAGINLAGTIPGYYTDSSGVSHGFVRGVDGTITPFDVPGAGTGAGQGTFGETINLAGDVAGMYIDARGVAHGFVSSRHGEVTTIDAPGAGTGSAQGTFPQQNNLFDAITGWYIDASGVQHGFLWSPS